MKIQHLVILIGTAALAACSGNSGSSGDINNDSSLGAPAEVTKPADPSEAGLGKEQVEENPAPPALPPAIPASPPSGSLPPLVELTPQYNVSIQPGLNNLTTYNLLKRLVIHGSQCQWRSNKTWQGQGNHYAESTYLCPVELPNGAKVSKVTLFPYSALPEEDPPESGLIALPADSGTYTWRSDFTAKTVALKADKSGYTMALVTDCAVKDWTFSIKLSPQELNCNYTQVEGTRLYFNLTGFLKAPNNELTSVLDQMPAVTNLIAVEYTLGK